MGFEVMNTRRTSLEIEPGFAAISDSTLNVTHLDLARVGIGKTDLITVLADKSERSIAVRKLQYPEKELQRRDGPLVANVNVTKALAFIGCGPEYRRHYPIEIDGQLSIIRLENPCGAELLAKLPKASEVKVPA